jgi:hypothetical protein
MCIFRPQRAGNVPRSHSTLESGVAPATVRGGVLRRTKLRDPPGNAVNRRLRGKIFIDFHANEPMTGKRQLSKGATP